MHLVPVLRHCMTVQKVATEKEEECSEGDHSCTVKDVFRHH